MRKQKRILCVGCPVGLAPLVLNKYIQSIQRVGLEMLSSLSTVLPGQPIVLSARAPVPQHGTGVYERGGQIRASVIGTPRLEGSVRPLFASLFEEDLYI